MTMRAVTLRRKQEKRKNRRRDGAGGHRPFIQGKRKTDADRELANQIKRQLRGYPLRDGFGDLEPFADWELELLGWKKGDGIPEEYDIIPEEYDIAAIVPMPTEVISFSTASPGKRFNISEQDAEIQFHPATAEGKPGWAQTKPGNKHHRVTVTKGVVQGVDDCPVARKADFNQVGAVLRFSKTYLESNTCAVCAAIGA